MLGLLQPLTVQKRDGKYAVLAGGQAHHPRYAALPGWRERAALLKYYHRVTCIFTNLHNRLRFFDAAPDRFFQRTTFACCSQH